MENITGEKGYANIYASTIYMPLNDLAKFKGGADTENGERMKRAKLVGHAQRPGGQTEVGADGGAASLERQCVDSGLDAENAAKTVVVDISRDPDSPANSAKDNAADTMLALERFKTFVPLALGDADQAAHPSLCDFITADIEKLLPGVLRQTISLNESSTEADLLLGGESGESRNADDTLYSFCEQLHTRMMEVWESTNTCLTCEQLQNIARGTCVHEEIADLLMGVLCGVLGASYLDSSGEIHHCSKGRWAGHLKTDESVAARTLVLACTFSAQVEAGEPKFVSRFSREGTLAPFSSHQ